MLTLDFNLAVILWCCALVCRSAKEIVLADKFARMAVVFTVAFVAYFLIQLL